VPDDDLTNYFNEHYSEVVYQGAGGMVQRHFHRALERPWKTGRFARVLELGATNAEHLTFVHHDFERYTMIDINDSSTARAAAASEAGRVVEFAVGDAQTLTAVADASVDRLVSMCLLHHLDDPDGALHNWRRVVKPGGVISVFVPCDPGVLWRFGRFFTTFRAAKRLGMSDPHIRYLNARAHRNHVASLDAMVAGVFSGDDVRVRRFPFRIASWNANLYYTYQITKAT
jgi:SAM-dependent methyltransferase